MNPSTSTFSELWEAFLLDMQDVGGRWTRTTNGKVRHYGGTADHDGELTARECPLTAVANAHAGFRKFLMSNYRSAGAELGFSPAEADSIANAADGFPRRSHDKDTRLAILQAVGLPLNQYERSNWDY